MSELSASQSAARHVLAALYFLHQPLVGNDPQQKWPKNAVSNITIKLDLDKLQMSLSRLSNHSDLPPDLAYFIRINGENSAVELLRWMTEIIAFVKPVNNDGVICLNHEVPQYWGLLQLIGKSSVDMANLGRLLFSGCLEKADLPR